MKTNQSQLINIQETDGVQTVNARELHAFLEVGKDFSTWMVDRIRQYGFEQGTDYSPELGNNGQRGKPRTEYHLSLDMAKELSMVERNAKGRFARQYFIECEKRLVQSGPKLRELEQRVEALEDAQTPIPVQAEPYFAVLRAQIDLGVPAATAARNAIRLAPPAKSAIGLQRHQDLAALGLSSKSRIEPADAILHRMMDDKPYNLDEILKLLPENHPIRFRPSRRGQLTALGRLMHAYTKEGKTRFSFSENNRSQFTRVPAILPFTKKES